MVELRQRHSLSLKGLTLWDLMQIAHITGFVTRALRVGPEHLHKLKPASILHWDVNHFVVLQSVNNREARILDPARGALRMTLDDLSTHFTGVVLELAPTAELRAAQENLRFSLRSLWRDYRALPVDASRVVALSALLQVTALLTPLYLQSVVDRVLPSGNLDMLLVLAVGFAMLAITKAAVELVRGMFIVKLSATLVQHMGASLFHHLMRVPISYLERRHLGDVIARFRSIDAVRRTLTTQFVEALIDGVVVAIVLVMMLIYSLQLTLVALLATSALCVTRFVVFQRFREASAEQLDLEGREHAYFLESMRAAQSIRLFNHQAQRESTWQGKYLSFLNADARVARIGIGSESTRSLLFGLESVVIIALGADAVIDGLISVGALLAFIAFKDQFTGRAGSLIDCVFELRMLRLHAERISDIAMTPPEKLDAVGESTTVANSPIIQIRNLGFRYSETDPWVLREVNFDVKDGECVVITGASGSGKTTLLKVMLSLLQATHGDVYLDGRAIPQWGLSAYRAKLAAVMQDDHLLSGTLIDNITYFDLSPDKDHAIKCAKTAMIHQDIQAMPMGYQTLVGDMGSTLSGGQRQRVLLARALYQKPRILLLDESTSHLDSLNEMAINHTLRRLSMTRVIVAHRAETIALGDRVLTLESGQATWTR